MRFFTRLCVGRIQSRVLGGSGVSMREFVGKSLPVWRGEGDIGLAFLKIYRAGFARVIRLQFMLNCCISLYADGNDEPPYVGAYTLIK
jgi:hypothetical protein